MELSFQTRALRDTCESTDKLRRQYGDRAGESVKARLADLRAASTINDVVIGTPREVSHDGRPAMTLDLEDGYTMVFCPNHLKTPVSADASVDWSSVSRIKILAIEGSNG